MAAIITFMHDRLSMFHAKKEIVILDMELIFHG
jgi:hypothetical protein